MAVCTEPLDDEPIEVNVPTRPTAWLLRPPEVVRDLHLDADFDDVPFLLSVWQVYPAALLPAYWGAGAPQSIPTSRIALTLFPRKPATATLAKRMGMLYWFSRPLLVALPANATSIIGCRVVEKVWELWRFEDAPINDLAGAMQIAGWHVEAGPFAPRKVLDAGADVTLTGRSLAEVR